MNIIKCLYSVIILALLSGCYSLSIPNRNNGIWTYSNLRLLDPSDTSDPMDDIIAVYSREVNSGLEIRLDFLDDSVENNRNIRILFDTMPGKRPFEDISFQGDDLNWDYSWFQEVGHPNKIISRDGQMLSSLFSAHYYDPISGGSIYKLENVPFIDSGDNFSFRILITDPESSDLLEDTGYVSFSGPPTVNKAHLILAFWNALPAGTPAQLLRRWDGAHTGPYGQRHGLNHLLLSSTENDIPVILLDLKTPESLLGLEYLGKIQKIKDQENNGNIILPQVILGDPQTSNLSLRYSALWGNKYGFPESPYVFGPAPISGLPSYPVVFLNDPRAQYIRNYQGRRFIPLPAPFFPYENSIISDQVDRFGLTNSAKKILMDAALSDDPSRLVVFGGDLSETGWGDSNIAPGVFAYLSSHPWIHILSREDILTFQSRQMDSFPPSCRDLLCTPPFRNIDLPDGQSLFHHLDQIRSEILKLEDNTLTDQAWLTYFNFTSPSAVPGIYNLRRNYIDRLDNLLKAAEWASEPHSIAECQEQWCILANENTFLQFSSNGARLLLAVTVTGEGYRQWVAPVSQIFPGMDDPQSWNLSSGEGSDPSEIPGAFVDMNNPFAECQVDVSPGILFYRCNDNGITKTYHLMDNKLELIYHSDKLTSVKVPLVSLPVLNYTQNCENMQSVEITFQNVRSSRLSYCDSIKWMSDPEDPDNDYPPGHYIPFPFSVLELLPYTGDFSVLLDLKNMD